MTLRRAQRLPKNNRGAALLAALLVAGALAIVLTSYVAMCYTSLKMSTLSANSGHSAELAETGMEEALWALHNNDWTGWSTSGTSKTKILNASSGYTFSYDGAATGSVSLTISNYDGTTGSRTVTSTGTITLSDGTTQNRTLASTSSPAPLFVNAIAATGNSTTTYPGRVRFKSGGLVDSYDSTVTTAPVSGSGFSAVVASKSDLTSAQTSTGTVQLTSATIDGYVAVMPGSAGLYSGASAVLHGTSVIGNPKVDTSRISSSPYQPIFDVITPSGAMTALTGGSQTLGTAGATSPTYYYYTGDLYLGDNSGIPTVLTVNGPVVLVISGYLATEDTSKIQVRSGGSVTIFVGGGLWLDGNGIENQTLLPKNVAVLAQTGNSSQFEFTTGTPFYGVLYAPNSLFNFYNYGVNPTIFGSIVGQQVVFNSSCSPTFHYDTSLRNVSFAGIDTPFAVNNLSEQ